MRGWLGERGGGRGGGGRQVQMTMVPMMSSHKIHKTERTYLCDDQVALGSTLQLAQAMEAAHAALAAPVGRLHSPWER